MLEQNKSIIKNNADITGMTEEQMSGFGTIKIFKLAGIVEKFRNIQIDKTERSKEKFDRTISFSNSTLGIFVVLLSLAVYYFGGKLVFLGTITVGGLVGLNTVLGNIVNQCVFLPQYIQFINSSKAVRDKCNEIYNYKDDGKNTLIPKDNYDIKVENLSFKYGDNTENILNDVSVVFEKGKKYAIIGDNGCGKSTLVKLIAGIYNSYSGSIKYGDYEQKDVDANYLYDLLSYVEQQVFIFDDSIENNIRLYDDTKVDEYKKVIKMLGVDKIIEKCKTENKNALELSGGERQKVSLARVLLRNSNILIADEPTAALDKKSSDDFEDLILSLKDILCIVITHNVGENLRNYDKVVVMKNGKIVEVGHYDELITINKSLVTVSNN